MTILTIPLFSLSYFTKPQTKCRRLQPKLKHLSRHYEQQFTECNCFLKINANKSIFFLPTRLAKIKAYILESNVTLQVNNTSIKKRRLNMPNAVMDRKCAF